MAHLKRLPAPRSWAIKRKGIKFIAKPMPGSHSISNSLPIVVILRDILKLVVNAREAKKLFNDKKVLVNKKPVKELNYPVGIMDILEIPEIGDNFIILFDENGKIYPQKVKKEYCNENLCKIIGKKILKKGILQLNLHNSWNILVDKNTKDAYKVGDSVLVSNKKIVKHLKLEKNAYIYLTSGKHVGSFGAVESIKAFKGVQDAKVTFKIGNETFETLKEYAFVVDKDLRK